ncbi:thiamine-phosphate kinase [Pseudogemmatithrix spongiicola]|uniref:Thiamine-monophosphate kinase n=1 Tax=Pseudogemmatithrix spongiicola TaxID=3062599 RepID=A0AA49Q4G3_9BACT|nr:thiamine-phosphate kinase [Gemmatimonadaceae bacterium 'strain 138']WKW14741.1 thiamine-phosphate kinase [Gemmatimonadaceae bacterium 'strain 318']
MNDHLAMGPGREFDAVRALLAQWGPAARGVGDDAAVLDVPVGEKLVVSTDSTVEEVHFRRAWLSAEEIGWRATQAALSDLAAMGAAPLGVLLALTVPRDWRAALPELAAGIGAATGAAGAPIVGGDVTDGDRLALAITVLGHARRPLSRAGARPGDVLYVTGVLGGPGAALDAWMAGREPGDVARARFARPEARIAAGQWLAAHGATAALDLSDGLAGDVAHLAAASGVACVLELDAVPCLAGVRVDAALQSGEEYELLVAAPAMDAAAFAAAHAGLRLTAVGRVEALSPVGAAGAVRAERGGAPVALPRAHDHFAR